MSSNKGKKEPNTFIWALIVVWLFEWFIGLFQDKNKKQ
jgi:hypothetical protein